MMTEYVVTVSSDFASGERGVLLPTEIRERIVRCRDCVHRYIDSETFEESVELCGKLCYMVDPDGFCAWGTAKGDDGGVQVLR